MIDVSTAESIVAGLGIIGGLFLLRWWYYNAKAKAARGPLPYKPKPILDGKGNEEGDEGYEDDGGDP